MGARVLGSGRGKWLPWDQGLQDLGALGWILWRRFEVPVPAPPLGRCVTVRKPRSSVSSRGQRR